MPVNQTWRKLPDGTMELVSEETVERQRAPDVDGLLDAVIDTLGEDATEQLLRQHPLIERSLMRGHYARARRRLDQARDDGDITSDTHDQLIALAADYHVPVPGSEE